MYSPFTALRSNLLLSSYSVLLPVVAWMMMIPDHETWYMYVKYAGFGNVSASALMEMNDKGKINMSFTTELSGYILTSYIAQNTQSELCTHANRTVNQCIYY